MSEDNDLADQSHENRLQPQDEAKNRQQPAMAWLHRKGGEAYARASKGGPQLFSLRCQDESPQIAREEFNGCENSSNRKIHSEP